MTYKQLTIEERYQIKASLGIGISPKDISIALNRHHSTIIREVKRNTGKRGYRPEQANKIALKRRKTACKAIKLTDEVKASVERLIRQELSPEQVCLYLKEHRDINLHHDTIYRFVAEDKANGGELYTFMRHLHKTHRKKYGSYQKRGRIKNATSIEERPEVIENKERIGDWEGDLIIGKDHKGALYTLVERKTLYTIIIKLTGKNATDLANKIIPILEPIKDSIHSITYDNGLEFAEHERVSKALKLNTYFAHPYSSWERGINENTNGLIRQYFPKGTDFNDVAEKDVQYVMDRLNSRPRKTRGGKQPIELFLGKGKVVDLLAA